MDAIEKLNTFQFDLRDVTDHLDYYVSASEHKSTTFRLSVYDPLVLEDILNPRQRIKIEFYEDYVFIVLKMITRPASETMTQINNSLHYRERSAWGFN